MSIFPLVNEDKIKLLHNRGNPSIMALSPANLPASRDRRPPGDNSDRVLRSFVLNESSEMHVCLSFF